MVRVAVVVVTFVVETVCPEVLVLVTVTGCECSC